MSNNILVGKYNTDFNKILGLDYKDYDIVCSKGIPSHMKKGKHFDALRYVDNIPDIIENPDYIGYDEKDENKSITYIKKYNRNVFLSVKLDIENDFLYVATMFIKEEKKIDRMLHSGKLKEIVDIK